MRETGDFAKKLQCALDFAGLSRRMLARLAGVDKSAANRWLAGQTLPSEVSLERITAQLRVALPELSLNDWQLPFPQFDAAIKAAPAGAIPGSPVGNDITSQLASYGGAWLFFHASMQSQPRISCSVVEFHREGQRLIATVGHAGIWRGTGPVFAKHTKLFLSSDDQLRGTAMAYWAMWGVPIGIAAVLDGLNMTQANDLTGSLAATRCLAFRLAGPVAEAERELRFGKLVERMGALTARALGEALPHALRAVFEQPPPVEGLPCVQRVTADRSLAISLENLRLAEPPEGPRRRALADLAKAFAPALSA